MLAFCGEPVRASHLIFEFQRVSVDAWNHVGRQLYWIRPRSSCQIIWRSLLLHHHHGTSYHEAQVHSLSRARREGLWLFFFVEPGRVAELIFERQQVRVLPFEVMFAT